MEDTDNEVEQPEIEYQAINYADRAYRTTRPWRTWPKRQQDASWAKRQNNYGFGGKVELPSQNMRLRMIRSYAEITTELETGICESCGQALVVRVSVSAKPAVQNLGWKAGRETTIRIHLCYCASTPCTPP